MKKLLSAVLAAAMALSLAACGGSPAPSKSGSTPTPNTGSSASSGSSASEPAEWVPTKDIEFVIPFGAGGGNDVMVRKIIEIIEKNNLCPVNIVPVNKSGGSGVVGYTYLISLGAGNEYALASTSASFYTQPLTGNSPYTPDETNFSFAAHMVKDPVVIVANPALGLNNMKDVVDYAKAHPGELKWGGVGNASDDAIIMYMLNDVAGIDLTYVPYDDGGLLQAAVLGGHIGLAPVSLYEVQEHLEAGTMVAIAACADERFTALPDVPTVIEEGYDIAHQQSRGIVMNAGVAEEVLAYYSDLFRQVSETPEWQEFTEANAMTNSFMPYDEFDDYAKEMMDDYSKYLALIPD